MVSLFLDLPSHRVVGAGHELTLRALTVGDEGGRDPLDTLGNRDGPHHLEQHEAFLPVIAKALGTRNTYWHQTHSVVSHTLPVPNHSYDSFSIEAIPLLIFPFIDRRKEHVLRQQRVLGSCPESSKCIRSAPSCQLPPGP